MQGNLFCVQFGMFGTDVYQIRYSRGEKHERCYRPRSLMQIMNDVLSTVRDYYAQIMPII